MPDIDGNHAAPDRVLAATGDPPRGAMPGLLTYAVLAAWFGAVATVAIAGGFDGEGAAGLALPAALAAPVAAVAVGYGGSARFRSYLLALDPRVVLAAQLWRVVGAAFLVALAFDRLPAGFAVPAGAGDLATGLAAMAVVVALADGTLTRRGLYAFTALGVGDFAVAMATGLILAPPALATWPLVVFPTFMVPFFAVLHLVAVLQGRHTLSPARGARLSVNRYPRGSQAVSPG